MKRKKDKKQTEWEKRQKTYPEPEQPKHPLDELEKLIDEVCETEFEEFFLYDVFENREQPSQIKEELREKFIGRSKMYLEHHLYPDEPKSDTEGTYTGLIDYSNQIQLKNNIERYLYKLESFQKLLIELEKDKKHKTFTEKIGIKEAMFNFCIENNFTEDIFRTEVSITTQRKYAVKIKEEYFNHKYPNITLSQIQNAVKQLSALRSNYEKFWQELEDYKIVRK